MGLASCDLIEATQKLEVFDSVYNTSDFTKLRHAASMLSGILTVNLFDQADSIDINTFEQQHGKIEEFLYSLESVRRLIWDKAGIEMKHMSHWEPKQDEESKSK